MRNRADAVSAWLLTALFALVPGQISALFWLVVLLLLVAWAAGGRWGERWALLRANPFFWVCQAFFWVQVLGLGWTEDMTSGLDTIARAAPFALLAPVLLTVVRAEHTRRHVDALLLGIAVSVVLASYNWLQLNLLPDWPAGVRMHHSPADSAPFIDRLLYAPLLAMAGYLAARAALEATGARRAAYGLLWLGIVANLIFSGGRTGVVAFFALMLLLALQRLRRRPWLGLAVGSALVAAVFAAGYLSNAQFRERARLALDEALHYEERVNTSVGLRINLAINSLRAFAESPWLGAGTGDFAATYREVNARHTPHWHAPTNPHNQYLLVLVTTGSLGGLALLALYLPPGLWRIPWHDGMDDLRLALALWIAVISLVESYLWRSNTSLLFLMLSALVYAPARGRADQ